MGVDDDGPDDRRAVACNYAEATSIAVKGREGVRRQPEPRLGQ